MANRLINELSPYLLQHAHNPVDWYAWGDEPFEVARRENKPVLVSIGYAACHWCHVMEHESFENEAVAAYMNANFINIKVDREEHPDVDHFYMDAVQAISGSGGWPLNVFVTPDRTPFYGGTYYPPRPMYNRLSWTQLLERIYALWTEQKSEIDAQGQQMLQYLRQTSQLAAATADSWTDEQSRQAAETLLLHADKEYGGFGKAPKFPGSMNISYLLEHNYYTGDDAALKQALLSLDCMIDGGIYDQLGGGFARYSTDDKWLAPHFEKMLYDNALIILVLCDAYTLTKQERYRRAIIETISFAERELKEPSGGYYSALDADSEGVEGKFYTWTWEEWQAAMGNSPVLERYFGIQKEGNWEHTNILHVSVNVETIAAETGFKPEEIAAEIAAAKQRLFDLRAQRIRPQTDDKSLLSWNALMNLAFTKASVALEHKAYEENAVQHMHWMLDKFAAGDTLCHTWKQGVARISANLDDYAYLIQALLQLASASGKNEWLATADKYAQIVLDEFGHEEGNMFYYTSVRQKDIPVRKVDVYDGATPSANAVMAHNLLLLGLCMDKPALYEQAGYMLRQMSGNVLRYPSSFGYWALQLQRYARGLKTVVSVGAEAAEQQNIMRKELLPQAFFITSQKEISETPALKNKYIAGAAAVYVCTDTYCMPPVSLAGQAIELIRSK